MSRFITLIGIHVHEDGSVTERPCRVLAEALLCFERTVMHIAESRTIGVTHVTGGWQGVGLSLMVKESPDIIESMVDKAVSAPRTISMVGIKLTDALKASLEKDPPA